MTSETEFFAALYRQSPKAVWVFAAQGEAIYCNPQAVALQERLGCSVAEIYAPMAEVCARCVAQARGEEFAFLQEEPLGLFIFPYFYEEAAYAVAEAEVGAGQDVLQVLHRSGAKLNGYLNGIYSVAQQLGLESEFGSRIGRDVHRILRMKNHLYQLLDREGVRSYLVPVNAGSFLENYARQAIELKPNLNLQLLPLEENLFVRMMPEDMEVVLSALVSNAYRFGAGYIAFSAAQAGDRIALTVANDGAAPAHPDRLFEWGYREADNRGAKGLGFSLAMSRKLLRSLGGDLTYSRVNGQTLFTILLPPSDLPAGTELAEWGAESRENSLSQLRIELSDIL